MGWQNPQKGKGVDDIGSERNCGSGGEADVFEKILGLERCPGLKIFQLVKWAGNKERS
jgi:hypothetical protein